MNFFEIVFLSFASIYALFLTGFLIVLIYNTIIDHIILNKYTKPNQGEITSRQMNKNNDIEVIDYRKMNSAMSCCESEHYTNSNNEDNSKILKNFAFEIESYLAYYNDEDTLTKKEILVMICEILKEKYNIKTKEVKL